MATFRTYAKVLKPDDAPARLHEAGISTCPGGPGQVLADVLARTGGVYETRMPLTVDLRERIREVAELTADAELLAISELPEVTVSLEHLRGIDPRTRVRIGAGLYFEGDEGRRVRPDSGAAVATILPDGTVVPGAWHPGKAADGDL